MIISNHALRIIPPMSTSMPAPALELRSPWLNAAGSLGFAPDVRGPVAIGEFGAFVTNPISVRPRRASRPPRLLHYPGGVLLHTGHPNPGISSVIKHHAAAWARAQLPIIIHLQAAKPEELRKAILRVEGLENVIAIELGLEAGISASEVTEILRATQGELPLIVQVPVASGLEFAEIAMQAEAAAISLAAPRGALPDPDGKLVSGRLYGPAVFPLALEAVHTWAKAGIPVIAAGGIQRRSEGEAMLAAGAMAVQVDVGLWKRNPLID